MRFLATVLDDLSTQLYPTPPSPVLGPREAVTSQDDASSILAPDNNLEQTTVRTAPSSSTEPTDHLDLSQAQEPVAETPTQRRRRKKMERGLLDTPSPSPEKKVRRTDNGEGDQSGLARYGIDHSYSPPATQSQEEPQMEPSPPAASVPMMDSIDPFASSSGAGIGSLWYSNSDSDPSGSSDTVMELKRVLPLNQDDDILDPLSKASLLNALLLSTPTSTTEDLGHLLDEAYISVICFGAQINGARFLSQVAVRNFRGPKFRGMIHRMRDWGLHDLAERTAELDESIQAMTWSQTDGQDRGWEELVSPATRVDPQVEVQDFQSMVDRRVRPELHVNTNTNTTAELNPLFKFPPSRPPIDGESRLWRSKAIIMPPRPPISSPLGRHQLSPVHEDTQNQEEERRDSSRTKEDQCPAPKSTADLGVLPESTSPPPTPSWPNPEDPLPDISPISPFTSTPPTLPRNEADKASTSTSSTQRARNLAFSLDGASGTWSPLRSKTMSPIGFEGQEFKGKLSAQRAGVSARRQLSAVFNRPAMTGSTGKVSSSSENVFNASSTELEILHGQASTSRETSASPNEPSSESSQRKQSRDLISPISDAPTPTPTKSILKPTRVSPATDSWIGRRAQLNREQHLKPLTPIQPRLNSQPQTSSTPPLSQSGRKISFESGKSAPGVVDREYRSFDSDAPPREVSYNSSTIVMKSDPAPEAPPPPSGAAGWNGWKVGGVNALTAVAPPASGIWERWEAPDVWKTNPSALTSGHRPGLLSEEDLEGAPAFPDYGSNVVEELGVAQHVEDGGARGQRENGDKMKGKGKQRQDEVKVQDEEAPGGKKKGKGKHKRSRARVLPADLVEAAKNAALEAREWEEGWEDERECDGKTWTSQSKATDKQRQPKLEIYTSTTLEHSSEPAPQCPPSPALKDDNPTFESPETPKPETSRPSLRWNGTGNTLSSAKRRINAHREEQQRAPPPLARSKRYRRREPPGAEDGEAQTEDPVIASYARTHADVTYGMGSLAGMPVFKDFLEPTKEQGEAERGLGSWSRQDGEAKRVLVDGSGVAREELDRLEGRLEIAEAMKDVIERDLKGDGGEGRYLERGPFGSAFWTSEEGQRVGGELLEAEEARRAREEADKQAAFEQEFLHHSTSELNNGKRKGSDDSVKSAYGPNDRAPSESARRDSDPITSSLGLLQRQGHNIVAPTFDRNDTIASSRLSPSSASPTPYSDPCTDF